MNKIIVSIVLTVMLVVGINKITDIVYYVDKPEKSAYQIENTVVSTSTKEVETTSETGNIIALFSSVNTGDGEKIFKKCAACHSIAQGGGNKIGPALWGGLGRKAGAVTDYKYSKAIIAHGKPWSFEEMDGFLKKPKDWIKGTKMSFAGLKNEKERAAVILYMNKNSDNPLPLN